LGVISDLIHPIILVGASTFNRSETLPITSHHYSTAQSRERTNPRRTIMVFNNKVALVTGGTSGIGEATAIAFAREGAKVIVAGRRQAEGTAVVEKIRTMSGDAIFVRADVTQEEDIQNLVSKAVEHYGRLDYAFNNAGVESPHLALADQSLEHFETIMAVNVRGVFLSLKYEIPAILKTSGGAIVNTSSVCGLVGFAGVSPYVASKHAVIGLTRVAALDYAKHGIRVNAVAPGIIKTPMVERLTGGNPEVNTQKAAMHPMGRLGQPDEVAEAVIWLCSDKSSFVTGQWITMDGGLTAT
jgi:NAD(P)-dependent dehydrogenase (short-subunit alcohol dehydrogenase family)